MARSQSVCLVLFGHVIRPLGPENCPLGPENCPLGSENYLLGLVNDLRNLVTIENPEANPHVAPEIGGS